MKKNIICTIQCCIFNLFFLQCSLVFANDSINLIEKKQAIAELTEWVSLIDELRSKISPLTLNKEGALDVLDYNLDEIISYVTEISYKPYPGVLKGVEGTINTQSGNSLDQSLTLATLLNDAGYDARIAHKELTKKQATLLLKSVFHQKIISNYKGTRDPTLVLKKIMAKLINSPKPEETGDKKQNMLFQAEKNLDSHFALLLNTLENNGYELKSKQVAPEIIKDVQQYYWVQYRTGDQKSWENAYPADQGGILKTLVPEKVFVGEVPKELIQTFEIQAFARRRLNDKTETIPLMQTWRRPVSAIVNSGVNFSLGTPDVYKWMQKTIKANNVTFVPMIGNNPAPNSLAFDLHGNVAPLDIAFSPLSPLFKTIGSKTLSAIEELGSINTETLNKKPIMAIEEIWLEIRLTSPKREKKFWKRSFYLENNKQSVKEVGRSVYFSFLTSSLSPQSLVNHILENLSGSIRSEIKKNQKFSINDNAYEDKGTFIKTLIQVNKELKKDVISYRDEPLILAYHQSQLDESPAGYDIINNSRQSLKLIKGEILTAPKVTMKYGVWETISETIGAQALTENKIVSTVTELDKYTGNSASSLKVSDSDNNYLRVFTSDPKANRVWWKIDKSTGTTLGINELGWGGTTEYVVTDTTRFIACNILVNVMCTRNTLAIKGWITLTLNLSDVLEAGKVFDFIEEGLKSIGIVIPLSLITELINLFKSGLPIDAALDKIGNKYKSRCMLKNLPECARKVIKP